MPARNWIGPTMDATVGREPAGFGTMPTKAHVWGTAYNDPPTITGDWSHNASPSGFGGDRSFEFTTNLTPVTLHLAALSAGADEDIRLVVNFADMTAGNFLFLFLSASEAIQCFWTVEEDMKVRVTDGDSNETVAASALPDDIVEFKVVVTARATGRLRVYARTAGSGGAFVLQADTGVANCRDTFTAEDDFAFVEIQVEYTGTVEPDVLVYLADYAQASSGTLTDTEKFVVGMRPTADVTTESTPSTGTDVYAVVDEDPVDTGDYTSCATPNLEDEILLGPNLQEDGDVWGVAVIARAQADVGSTLTSRIGLRLDTTDAYTTVTPDEGAWDTVVATEVLDPDGNPWTGTTVSHANGLMGTAAAGTGELIVAWFGVAVLTDELTGDEVGEPGGDGNPEEAENEPPYRALIVPDPRFVPENIWADESDYTPVGPRPGVPVDQGDVRSRMVLQATGSQAAASIVTITAARAGFPDDGAGFAYTTGAPSASYIGWDPPAMITGFEWVHFVANGATNFRAKQPHAIRLQSGDLLACARVSGTTPTGATTAYAPGVFKLDGATGDWTYIDEVDTTGGTSATTQMTSPCLLQLPSGRVLCFFWRLASAAKAQIQVSYSDDDGATWTAGSPFALDEPVEDFANTSYSRLRAAYSNGQILLLGCPESADGVYMIQWASDDDGATFRTVWVQDHTASLSGWQDIIPDPAGGFDVYYVDIDDDEAEHKRIGSAFDSLEDVGATVIADDVEREMAVWETEDGTRWLAAAKATAASNVFLLSSRDRGATWLQVGNPTANTVDGGIWMGDDNEVLLENFAVAECRGRSYMITEINQATGTHDSYSLLCLALGGHTDITHPCFEEFPRTVDRSSGPVGWRVTWAAIEDPALFNDTPTWTAATGGAATGALTATGWRITAAGGADELSYEIDPSLLDADIDDTLVALIELTVNSGGSLANAHCSFRMRIADNTDDFEASVRMSTTGYRVFDNNTGAQLGSDQTLDMDGAEGVQIYLIVNGNTGIVQTFHRVITGVGASAPLRQFTGGVSDTLTTDAATPNAAPTLEWGSLAAGSTAVADWRLVCVAVIPYIDGVANNQYLGSTTKNSLDRMFVRPLSAQPVTVPTGVSVAAVDGPCLREDAWQISTRYEYPVENLFPKVAASPRQAFRTEQMGPTVLAWKLDENGEDTTLTSTSLGLSLRNTNVRRFTLQGYQSGGWVDIATVTNGHRNLRFVRNGNTVTVDTGDTTATGIPWHTFGSSTGGYVVLDNGGLISPTEYPRHIVMGSEGRWNEADGRRVTLLLDPDEVTGSEPADGDLALVYPDVTVLVHDVVGAYEAWRIQIPDQDYPASDDDQIRIGSIVFGPLVAFGRQYSATRSIDLRANTELTERRSGSRASRVLGPSRKGIGISWLEGVDTSELARAGTTSPTAIVATTWEDSPAIACPADTPFLVQGVADYLGGPDKLVVYLPRVPVEVGADGDPVSRALFLPETTLYARIVNSARTEVVLGDELESEVQRIAEIVLEEEP